MWPVSRADAFDVEEWCAESRMPITRCPVLTLHKTATIINMEFNSINNFLVPGSIDYRDRDSIAIIFNRLLIPALVSNVYCDQLFGLSFFREINLPPVSCPILECNNLRNQTRNAFRVSYWSGWPTKVKLWPMETKHQTCLYDWTVRCFQEPGVLWSVKTEIQSIGLALGGRCFKQGVSKCCQTLH